MNAETARFESDKNKPILTPDEVIIDSYVKDAIENIKSASSCGEYSVQCCWPMTYELRIARVFRKDGYRVRLGMIYATIRWDLTWWQKIKMWFKDFNEKNRRGDWSY